MKKILCLLLAGCLALCVCACKENNDPPIDPIRYYYRTRDIQYGTEEDVFAFETRDRFGHEEDYEYLVNDYLKGPHTEKCFSPFPAGTTLVQLDLVKDKVLVVLSSHISLLKGAELTVACTCLARTLHEMTGMKVVQISSDGDLMDGEPYVIIKKDDFTTQDDYSPTEPSDSNTNPG